MVCLVTFPKHNEVSKLTYSHRLYFLGLGVCQASLDVIMSGLITSRPVVVAENMIGCAMYELVSILTVNPYRQLFSHTS